MAGSIQAAGSAQGERPLLVGDAVAQAELDGCAATGGIRLGRRPVGLARSDPPGRPVGSLLVVGEPEGIELALELGDRAYRRLLPELALQGLAETLDLALGLGMAWGSVLLTDAQVGQQVLEAVAATGEARRADRTVVGACGRGQPCSSAAPLDVTTTSSPATRRNGVQASR